jgi:hypothetical protein
MPCGLLGLRPTPLSVRTIHRSEHAPGQAQRTSVALRIERQLVSMQYNPDLAAYYQAKLRQGKPKKKAIIIVARKLIRIVCALLKSQATYVNPG